MIDTDRLVADVRRRFPAYYAQATVWEMAWLDALVMARAAYLLGIGTPREGVEPKARVELERATDLIEKRFVELRDRVRTSIAFQHLSAQEQRRAEMELFVVEVA